MGYHSKMNLETPRLQIKEFTEDGFEDFFLLVGDPEVMRYSLKGPLNREQAQKSFKDRILGHYKTYGYGLWSIFLKKEKKFIGLAGLLTRQIEGEEKVELAYRLLPVYWGHGLAVEAAAAIADYAFSTLKINFLISIIDVNNHRGLLLAKRLGMQVVKKTLFHNFEVLIYGRSHSQVNA